MSKTWTRLCFVAVVGFACAQPLHAQTPATGPSRSAALLARRIELAQRGVDLARQLYERGLLDFAAVGAAQQRLLRAHVDAATTPAQRLQTLRQLETQCRATLELVQSRFQAGLTTEFDVVTAEFQLLDVQVEIEALSTSMDQPTTKPATRPSL